MKITTIGIDKDTISAARFIAKEKGLAPTKHFATVARMAILAVAKDLGWTPTAASSQKKGTRPRRSART